MSETNFKKGDRVIRYDLSDMENHSRYGFEAGKILTINKEQRAYVPGGQTLWFDDMPPGYDGPWHSHRFVLAATTTSKAINNYICKACRNDRCSSTEKSCWKCGEPINA